MNIQIYFAKKNFDVQKAERFLKERRVPFTEVDVKKHAPGAREIRLFAQAAGGMRALVDREAKGSRADYVKQLSIESVIEQELSENPALMRLPIVRNGQKAVIGYDEAVLENWIKEG